jgi:hypothetical protein
MQEWDPKVVESEQKCYSRSTTCILWEIFEGLNDWNIVQLLPGKHNDDEEIQTIHRIVLDAKIKLLCVQEEKMGHLEHKIETWMGINYLVKWRSQTYRLKAYELTEYNPPIHLPKEELVANAIYFNQVVPWHNAGRHQQLFLPLLASNAIQ